MSLALRPRLMMLYDDDNHLIKTLFGLIGTQPQASDRSFSIPYCFNPIHLFHHARPWQENSTQIKPRTSSRCVTLSRPALL